jgi:ubiquinone/menaquinone biosynthesis C-methylase UbiE
MIVTARAAAAAVEADDVEILEAEAERPPFADETFDAAVVRASRPGRRVP